VAAVRNRMEVDGLKTEEANAVLQVREWGKNILG
jgi:hypothetical protein